WYRGTFKRSYNLAFRILGNRADAEDVTQEAYLNAWRSFDGAMPAGGLDKWIHRVLTNLALNRIRYRRTHLTTSIDLSDENGACFEAPDPTLDPQRTVLSAELNQSIQSALLKLPADYRAVILLCDLEERSYREIAEIIDCPVGTVRS